MWNRQKSKEKFINNISEKETPFKPNMSKESLLRNSKTNRLDRSVSYKYLGKKNYDNHSGFLQNSNNTTLTIQQNSKGEQEK
jgi:hypothetical protein